MTNEFYERYHEYENVNVYELTRLSNRSYYNNNYYLGLTPEDSDEPDLIYVHSIDDDNIMNIYHIDGNNQIFIGYAYVDDGNIILWETELY